MTPYLSNKLRFLSFFAIILVVLIHSYDYFLVAGNFNYIVQRTISKGMAYMAVPLFFMLSGYFFFSQKKTFTREDYFSKLKKRVKTLLIPYLVVSALSILLFAVLNKTGIYKIGWIQLDIWHMPLGELLNLWLINPVSYQLWFIQYLILLCLISPIIYLLIRHVKYFYIVPVFLFWFVLYYKIDHPTISLTFFSLGAFLSINNITFPTYKKQYRLSSIVSILLWISGSYIALNYVDNEFWMNIVRNISILFGFISVWFLYDLLYSRWQKIFHSKIIIYVFFIYLFHEPFLTFAKYGCFYILKALTPLSSLLIYILLPTTIISVCIITGMLVKRYLPRFYNLITGSR